MEKNITYHYRRPPAIVPHYFEELSRRASAFPCGIDEAGRGPLAGPLVAAAAIVYGGNNPLLRDSKLLTPRLREEGYRWLLEQSWFGIGVVSPAQIDRIGIMQATHWAMERAFMQLCGVAPILPSCVLVDAVPLRLPEGLYSIAASAYASADPLQDPWGRVISFPRSEELSYSIAAASIIAKVTRDRLMEALGADFPGYAFAQHKGYGTLSHRETLAARGRSLLHRISFICRE